MDKVLPGKIFILISFKGKVFTHINSQQMWMNFNTFSSTSHVNCAIQIILTWMQLIKDGSCYIVNHINPSKFCPGKHVIRVNVNTMRIHSGVNSYFSWSCLCFKRNK